MACIYDECNFSGGWLKCFKLWHRLRKFDVSASKYFETFEQFVKDSDLTANQTHNGDETGLFWRCLPTSTLAGEGKTSRSGFEQN